MKKLFLVAAAAAMVMSSCSKNEVDSGSTTTQSNDAIGFSTFVGINTKGQVTDNADIDASGYSATTAAIKTSGFGVFGYYHPYTQAASSTAGKFDDTASTGSAADFMYNQEVKWDTYDTSNKGWVYSPVKYWPNNTLDRLSFFAYAPYSTSGVDITSTGTPSVEFTIADKPESMIDLVADMQYNVAKESANALTTAPSTVAFELQHILTRADIAVRLGDDITVTTDKQDADDSGNTNTYVYLTALKLVGTNDSSTTLYDATGATKKSTGLRAKGVFKVTASTSAVSSDDVTNNKYGTSGVTAGDYVVDYVLGAWDYTTTTKQESNYDLWSMVNEITEDTKIGTTGPSSSTVAGYNAKDAFAVPQPGTSSTSTETYTRVFDANHYLFLIPQQTATQTGSDAEVTYLYVQYDVVTVDSSLALGYSKVTNYAIIELSGLTTIGTAYRYNLTLGLSSVKVSATVDDDWTTSENQFGDIEVEVKTTTSDPDATV